MKFKKIIAVITLALLFVIGCGGKNNTNVGAQQIKDERELKAVWISSFIGEAPYNSEAQFKSHMNYVLDILEFYGYNAIIFHVRTHNNAFYESELNPVASWFSRVDFETFDPLEWLIDESHKRGIEFHAWMNPYRVSTTYQVGTIPEANPQSDPSNLIVEGGTILNPALPVVREHIYNTIIEFAEKYPTVEAIHFDDYFYISTSAEPTNANDRRHNIDLLIEGIHNVLKDFNEENDTNIQLGISPTGIYKNDRKTNGQVTYNSKGHPITAGSATGGFEHFGDYLYADTVKWAIEGWIDYLMPQTYWARNHGVASYTNLVTWWDKVFKYLDVNLYSGIGVYMADGSGNTYDWKATTTELDGQLTQIENLYENVEGYSLFSFKHLEAGYNGRTLQSALNIQHAYTDPKRTMVRVPPVIKNMAPKYVDRVININYSNGQVTWDSVSGGKFYYIYRSSDEVTYSSDEIIGVVGHYDGLMSYLVDDTNNYHYGVRALSKTNHLSEVDNMYGDNVNVTFDLGHFNEEPPLPQSIDIGEKAIRPYNPHRRNHQFLGWYLDDVLYDFNDPVNKNITLKAKWESASSYLISYNTSGGSLKPLTYTERNDMLDDFLTDFYTFLNIDDISLSDFIHGPGKTSGYDGLYNEEKYFTHLYISDNKRVQPNTGKFINQTQYNKWVPLIDLMDEYTKSGNSSQSFWESPMDVAIYRIKPFIRQINIWSNLSEAKEQEIMEILNLIPQSILNDLVYYEYTKFNDDIILLTPEKEGHIFLGWYTNSAYTGSQVTMIPSGSTGTKFLYAKWQEKTVIKRTVKFDLGYLNLSLPNKMVDHGTQVDAPLDPTRTYYTFLGWYLDDVLYDFNNDVNSSMTLSAKWEENTTGKFVQATFDLDYEENKLEEDVLNGTLIDVPTNPTRDNYTFKGWLYEGVPFNFNIPITEDIVLTALWEEDEVIKEVTINFDLSYDDLTLNSITINEGTKIPPINDPSRDGYIFKGWYLNDELFDFDMDVNDDLTLYAMWEEVIVEVETVTITIYTFDDYGMPAIELITVEKGTIPQKLEDLEKEGYIFKGWFNGQEQYLFDEPLYEDITLSPSWEIDFDFEEQDLIEMIDGASIRNSSDTIQRLRFYAKIHPSLLEVGLFGMFAIFGDTTTEELKKKIETAKGRDIFINNQRVLRRDISFADENNEFSVVLIGIPPKGYADRITVIAYAIDENGKLHLANNPITRSVLEVAVKMKQVKVNESSKPEPYDWVVDYANENMKKLSYDVYGNLEISKDVYEYDYRMLKTQFYEDYKKMFNTDLTELSAIDFYEALKGGSTADDKHSIDISGTNIYKFFKDPLNNIKWFWLLDFIIDVDYTIHASGQAEAIKGNGTYINPNLGSNKDVLYNGNHLILSLYNFFNATYETHNETAIDFLNTTPNIDGKNKYDRYNQIKVFNTGTYVDVSKYLFFSLGDKINLPIIDKEVSGNNEYVYFDGKSYILSNGLYKVTKELTFEYKLVSANSFSLNFYDQEIELLELRDYYLTTVEKELPKDGQVPKKPGFAFEGWYDNAEFSGNKVTSIFIGSTGSKIFYAKFEPISNVIIINYDLGEFGHHTTNKQELFEEFVRDYRKFFTRSYSLDSMLDDFFSTSYLPLPYMFEDFFLDEDIYEKWGWLETYILETAISSNYTYIEELENYSQSFWRINIHAFFNDMFHIHYGNDKNYPSIDFNNLVYANNFWRLTEYYFHTSKYFDVEKETLVVAEAVINWNPNYEFVGWINEEGNIVEELSDLSFGEHNLTAKFKELK